MQTWSPEVLQLYLKETPTQVFSCKYRKNFQEYFFRKHVRWLVLCKQKMPFFALEQKRLKKVKRAIEDNLNRNAEAISSPWRFSQEKVLLKTIIIFTGKHLYRILYFEKVACLKLLLLLLLLIFSLRFFKVSKLFLVLMILYCLKFYYYIFHL